MSAAESAHILEFRVRYSETDQLGTFYNSRVLEWFECGRTELLRQLGVSYADMELRGLCLPLVEAHVKYQGRARYDDRLVMTSRLARCGRASLRFDVAIMHAAADSAANHGGMAAVRAGPVAAGYTIHAITDGAGKPMRCPDWLAALLPPLQRAATAQPEGASHA
jgi:acyl-CoA thioester hydrolase